MKKSESIRRKITRRISIIIMCSLLIVIGISALQNIKTMSVINSSKQLFIKNNEELIRNDTDKIYNQMDCIVSKYENLLDTQMRASTNMLEREYQNNPNMTTNDLKKIMKASKMTDLYIYSILRVM